jgi:hypothetical protein
MSQFSKGNYFSFIKFSAPRFFCLLRLKIGENLLAGAQTTNDEKEGREREIIRGWFNCLTKPLGEEELRINSLTT